jgi:hypothetical protein
MKLDLKIRPFHPLHVSELSYADMNVRKDACRALLAALRYQRARGAVLFTDAWPLRSPDLTTPGSALGMHQGESQQNAVSHNRSVTGSFTHVTPDYLRKTSARTWRRIQLCYDDEGLHTDVLNSLSHEVRAHIKHSTITAIVHFSATLYHART